MVEVSPTPPSPEELGVVVDIESADWAVGFLSVVSPVEVVAAALAVVVVVVVVAESCDKLVMSPSNYQTKVFFYVNNFYLLFRRISLNRDLKGYDNVR